ncbi:inositol monophosphatase family protein [soil metagenome]
MAEPGRTAADATAADGVETADALAVAREAAADAVQVILAARGRRREITAKRPRDFVTDADRAAEERIVERLIRAFPGHAIVAEESAEESVNGGKRKRSAGGNRYRWIIDPLDGTTNFVHGFPAYAVSIALYEGDAPRAALVVDPLRGEWFAARAGEGARLDGGDPADGRDLAVTDPVDPNQRLVATGFPFRHPEQIERYLAAFRALFERVGDMRRAGSAALDLAYVAAGRVDGFWELGLNLWDIAAGELLVLEAGGRVSDWVGGAAHRQTGWVAAGGPNVHAMLVETLTEHA